MVRNTPAVSPTQPIVAAAVAQSVNEYMTLAINPAMSVAYSDPNREINISLHVNRDALNLDWKSWLSSYTRDGTSNVSWTSLLNTIHDVFYGLTHSPNHDYNGTETLKISADN